MSEKKPIDLEYGNIFQMEKAPPPPYNNEIIATSAVATPPPYVPPNVPAAPTNLSMSKLKSQNKPQSKSVAGSALLFIIAGMNMSWSAYTHNEYNSANWFIGAITGAIFGALMTTSIKRKYVIMSAAALSIIDGIIYMAASRSYTAVSAARYFDGLAIGVVFVPTMVLIGEQSVKEFRGMLASSVEMMCFYIGISIQTVFWQSNGNSIQPQGIMNVIFGILALAIVHHCYIESPVHHLLRGEEDLAIDCLRRFQMPQIITTATYEQLRDHKAYIEENENVMPAQSMKEALPALCVLIFYRSWVALSFSAITYAAIFQVSDGLCVIFYGFLSFFAAMVVCSLMDSLGRKKLPIIGAFICSCLAITIGVYYRQPVYHYTTTITCLLMAFQFFAAFSTSASSVYLTEAFPLSIKPYCIGLPFIVQMIVQVIIICNYRGASFEAYFYVAGVISMAMAGLLAFVLPETKKVTLLTAQNMFKNLFKRK